MEEDKCHRSRYCKRFMAGGSLAWPSQPIPGYMLDDEFDKRSASKIDDLSLLKFIDPKFSQKLAMYRMINK